MDELILILKNTVIGLMMAGALFSNEPLTSEEVKLAAIVVDDLGNNMEGTQMVLNFPFQVTVAVMPFLSSTQSDANQAYAQGHNVIVHMPMESIRGHRNWLGPGAISLDLTDEEIRLRVRAAIDNVPHAIGMNNHMGSKVTGNLHAMRIVMEVCKEKGIFFLDSHTNYHSVASKAALETGVPFLENILFLDDIKSKSHVHKQFQLVLKRIKEHNTCITIGHVGTGGKIMAEELRNSVSQVTDVRFVGLNELLEKKKGHFGLPN